MLLAALLPLRVAVATALPCAGPGMPAMQQHAEAPPLHAGGHPMAADPSAPAEQAHPHGAHHGLHHGDAASGSPPLTANASASDAPAGDPSAADDAAQQQKCTLCCAFCGAAPVPVALPQLPPPPAGGTALFAEPPAGPATFLSGGQDRPPRTA